MIRKFLMRSAVLGAALIAAPLTAQNFTTAAEVKPIVGAIKAQWIAVRPWNGQDLLYFTNLLSWRCGLSQISYSVNGGAEMLLVTEPCYEGQDAPNALKVDDILPYISFDADFVQTITVSVTYDDGTSDRQSYDRAAVQIN